MDSGIYRLQQEAARRVRLMEERNRQIANSYAPEPRLETPCPPAYTPPEVRRPPERSCPPPTVVAHPAPAPSEDDNERLLLLMLALLLAKNGAQTELIVALLYLAM